MKTPMSITERIAWIILLIVFAFALVLLFNGTDDGGSPVATPTIRSPLPTDVLPDPSEPTRTDEAVIIFSVGL